MQNGMLKFFRWKIGYLMGVRVSQITQPHKKNKGQELFRRPLYAYVCWGAESEFEVKIASNPISFGDHLKKRYFRVYDGKIWYDYEFHPLNLITKPD